MPTLADGSSVEACDVTEASDQPSKSQSSKKILSLNDWLFVEACYDSVKKHGHIDRVAAWRQVHGVHVKTNSAHTLAHNKLKIVEVQQALEMRLKADKLTKETITSVMWDVVERANRQDKLETVLAGCMDLLRARGELIDKKEVTTIEEGQKAVVSELVGRSLRQAGKEGKN